ncbi:MAG: hypothetical protein A2309_08900 [Bacteroidetes bacterium RIFOXYB2_FULL_35_7]|nr:MAG: hypothetical protein A2309_08900 [Bacteroidetes bacterium RIFOXYB2_FULL_35_7]
MIFFNSCSPTKLVPEKQYLLNKSSIKIDDKKIDSEALSNYIKQKPNKKLVYVFRFHLWVHNLANTGRKWKWKKKIGDIIGEKPVILDDFYTKKSVRQMQIYLKNKGYYNAKVQDSVIYYNNKTADVVYLVFPGKPYTVRNIEYVIDDVDIRNLVFSDTANSIIKKGVNFDVDKFQEERVRIARFLNTKGYYYFVKEYLDYQADSSFKENAVDVTMRLKLPVKEIAEDEFIIDHHRKQKIKDIFVYTDFDQKRAMQDTNYLQNFDTIVHEGVYFLYDKKLPIKPTTIIRNIYLKNDDYYDIRNVDKSYKFLSGLKIYKLINIQFIETKDTTDLGDEYLNVYIQFTPHTVQSYTFEVVGTNSSSDIGMGGNFIYQHKNLFRGAENFEFKLNGELQMLKNVIQEKEETTNINIPKLFNSLELGGEAKLYIPKFLLPVKSEMLSKKYEAKSTFTLSENYQQRPDYTRTITNASFGYFWKTSDHFKHFLNPFDINSIHIYDTIHGFSDSIPTYLKGSYDDFLITAINYSLVFNNQRINKSTDFTFFTISFETAGNNVNLYNKIANTEKNGEYYKLLNVRYAQYFKTDIDYRYYHFFTSKNNLATRLFLGLGLPYGNSNQLPFVKQYYCGGANGIRAWSVRSLGPGTYFDPKSTYQFQSADLKLESNIEYRFDIFWMFKGALFVDAGNIWFLNSTELGADAKFMFDRFYKDLAVGTGLGIRIDLSMFIFRFDFGLKLRDPKEEIGKRWIIAYKKFNIMDDFLKNINIGIGFPF